MPGYEVISSVTLEHSINGVPQAAVERFLRSLFTDDRDHIQNVPSKAPSGPILILPAREPARMLYGAMTPSALKSLTDCGSTDE